MQYLDSIDRLSRLASRVDFLFREETPLFTARRIEPWHGAILDYLSTAAAPVPVSCLVAVCKRYRSSLTKATDRLQEAGYLTKTPNPSDGRSLLVQITPAGEVALVLFRKAHRSVEKKLFKGISSSRLAELLDVLAIMENNVS